MAVRFEIEKKDKTREFIVDMSTGDIIEVGQKVGLETSEFQRIMDYTDYIEDEKIIESDDIQKILIFCQSLLDVLLQLENEGNVLLSSNEEIDYSEYSAEGGTLPREHWEGTTPRLRTLIMLCEKALAVHGSIIMIP